MTSYNVEFNAGFWQVRTSPATLVPLRNGGQPVAEFVTGWHAKCVYTGFAPILLLELERDDGSKATWYLDTSMNRLGGELHELTPETRSLLSQKYLEVTAAPWRSLMVSPEPVWPEIVDGLSDVNSLTLAELDRLARGPDGDEFTWHDVSGSDSALLTIENDGGASSAQLSADCLKSILSIDVNELFLAALKTKELTWPSPITGQPVKRVHGLYIDHMMVLYRCVDDDAKLVFYVCCAGHHLQNVGVLFPTVRRAFYMTAAQRHYAENVCRNLTARVMLYLTRSGRLLPAYCAQQLKAFATPLWGGGAFHIGHHLWNELTALHKVVTSMAATSYPTVIVLGNPGDGEAYGQVEELFPELAPRVVRGIRQDAEMVEFCCKNGLQIIRVTDSYVPESLRDRINNLVRANPDLETERALALRLRGEKTPVVVVGLRVENRTLVDCLAFYTRIVEHLERRLGRVAVVIDGHNARLGEDRAETYPSFTETRAAQPPTEVEKHIARSLQAAFSGTAVTIVDNIGGSMDASLYWLQESAFFVAPWGAGLAKYRWVANKQGVVVSSKWVLENKADLHIYDDEKFMEAPSEVRFIASKHVFDFAEAPVLVQVFDPHHPMYFNFKLNMSALYKEIDAMIEQTIV